MAVMRLNAPLGQPGAMGCCGGPGKTPRTMDFLVLGLGCLDAVHSVSAYSGD